MLTLKIILRENGNMIAQKMFKTLVNFLKEQRGLIQKEKDNTPQLISLTRTQK